MSNEIRIKDQRVGIWVFSDCEGCLEQVEVLKGIIPPRFQVEPHLDGSNEAVGGSYILSVLVGPVRRGIDLGQVSLIRRRSTKVLTISACATSIGREYFDGQTALMYYTPQHFVSSVAPEFQMRAPASDYIVTDFDIAGHYLQTSMLKRVVNACLDGSDLKSLNSMQSSKGGRLADRVERIVSFPPRRRRDEDCGLDVPRKCLSDQEMQDVVYGEKSSGETYGAEHYVSGASLSTKRFFRDFISQR